MHSDSDDAPGTNDKASPRFQPATEKHLQQLRLICGEERVRGPEWKGLARYGRDQVDDDRYAHPPEVVVFPESSDEVCRIMELSHAESVPVTPRGAGTGLSGGAVPAFGGICMSLELMDRILEIDTENLVATVEPGVVTKELQAQLRPYNLFFAGYPLSEEICTIGGNVAEDAGGGRAVKYGVTGDHVLGCEAVTPDGGRFELGGKRIKDVTGYDLLSLLVGSEGTLAVMTKIRLRLLPLPGASRCLIALFPDTASAIGSVPAVMRERGVVPAAVEFVDHACLHAACTTLNETIPYDEYAAMLLFEVDGQEAGEVRPRLERIRHIVAARGAWTAVSEGESDNERYWRIRKQVPWAVKRMGGTDQSHEDITLRIASVPPMMELLDVLAREFKIAIPSFGHAADGNMHAIPMRPESMSREEWQQTLPKVLRKMYKQARELGGTISGEHGIGHKRRDFMSDAVDATALDLMQRIRRALNPSGLLNPGKIFLH